MRIAKVMAPREIRLEDVPMPAPRPGEVLVRITAVGICGSDLQYYTQGRIGDLEFSLGHVLGHEVAGVVEALGSDVREPVVGTSVAVDPAIPCGRCRFCLAGHPNLCAQLRFFGSPPMGGALCDFIAHPNHLLFPLPSQTGPAVGAIIEPLGVAIHAVDLGHVALGDCTAVFGLGPIGLLIARVAQLAGAARVVATEPLAHRRHAAPGFGVAAAFDPTRDDVVRHILDDTGGTGVDVVFETAGSPEATEQAVRVLRPGGTLVLLGYWKFDQVTLPGITAMRKGLTIRFVRRMKNTFPRAIDLVRRELVNLPALITHEFPLDDVAHAFIRADARVPDVIKAVVRM
jgi:L-iditol 2-dehydrogenase